MVEVEMQSYGWNGRNKRKGSQASVEYRDHELGTFKDSEK